MKTLAACPACPGTMVEIGLGACRVEFCESGCGGLWFDESELERLDHASKGLGPGLRKVLAATRGPVQEAHVRMCPRCMVELVEEPHPLAGSVLVDVCDECAGMFLDSGELGTLRGRELTKAERQKKPAREAGRRPQTRARRSNLRFIALEVLATGLEWGSFG